MKRNLNPRMEKTWVALGNVKTNKQTNKQTNKKTKKQKLAAELKSQTS